jgi:hypothetical protein
MATKKHGNRFFCGVSCKPHHIAERLALVTQPLVNMDEQPTKFARQVNAVCSLMKHYLKLINGPEDIAVKGIQLFEEKREQLADRRWPRDKLERDERYWYWCRRNLKLRYRGCSEID